jgi:hypothetical protein
MIRNFAQRNIWPKSGNIKTCSPNLGIIKVNFWGIFLKKLRPKHLGDIFQEKMRPTPKTIAQVAKFHPNWGRCYDQNFLRFLPIFQICRFSQKPRL